MKSLIHLVTLAAASAILMAGCGANVPGASDDRDTGTLVGRITIGPECPVEPCDTPPGAIYAGRELSLLRSGASPLRVPLGNDGTFSVELVPADYVIMFDNCNFFGCGAFPLERTIVVGETVTLNLDLDTGIRTPSQGPGAAANFISELVGLGAVVAQGGSLSQDFFAVPGQAVIVDGEAVQVFEYATGAEAQADATTVSPSGSSVGPTMISWIATPHFFLKDHLLVLYVGDHGSVLARLETLLGPQFAGGDAPIPIPVSPDDPTANPDEKVNAYLDLMDEMADALGQIRRGINDDAMSRVREIGARFEEFVVFFVALDGDRKNYVIDTYGDQLQRSAERVAGLAQLGYEATGNDEIVLIVQRIPSFLIGSTETSVGSREPVIQEREIVQ